MSATAISPTVEIPMTENLANKTIPQLCNLWVRLQFEFNSLDASFNQNFTPDPLYSRQYRHLRQPLEALALQIKALLEPVYNAEIEQEREIARRLNSLGLAEG